MAPPSREQIEAAHQLGEAILRFLTVMRPNMHKPFEPRPPETVKPKPAEKGSPEKRLLSPREAASVLRVSERTLWSLTTPRGPIPAVRVGRAVRYSTDTLEAWIRQSEQ